MSDDQLKLLDNPTDSHGPVTCLGMEFENDEARRAYFTEQLLQKLQDPEFRAIEGFPIGEDKDILALSDPPYYTACPNPWIADFIAEWEAEKQQLRKPRMNADGHGFTEIQEHPSSSVSISGSHYHREPFAADVSEGKNDPIYNAHSYHTKVPHKAIMRYILHYTEPGDIVFDGFCGTGMTGVAAQMCGDRDTVLALGYQVKEDGTILQKGIDESGAPGWIPFSKLGARKAVLNDLSPAATFIAYNYNTPVDVQAFEQEAKRILQEVEDECGWMYVTIHQQPRINADGHGLEHKNIRVNPGPSVAQAPSDNSLSKANDTDSSAPQQPRINADGHGLEHKNIRVNPGPSVAQAPSDKPLSKTKDTDSSALQQPRINADGHGLEHKNIRVNPCPSVVQAPSDKPLSKAKDTDSSALQQPQINADGHRLEHKNIRVNPCPSVVQDNPDITFGTINYTVWSDVFICPECAGEVVFWEAAVDKEAGKVQDAFPCPHCNATLTKRNMERAWTSKYDSALQDTIRQARQVPVLINYSVAGMKGRFEKTPDEFDLALIEKIEQGDIPYWFPTDRMMEGKETRRNDPVGITHVYHFFTKRNLWVLAILQKRVNSSYHLQTILDGFSVTTVMSRFRVPAWINKTTGPMKGGTSGTLYIPSLQGEQSWLNVFQEKVAMIGRALRCYPMISNSTILSSSSLGETHISENSVDYLFIDPPFGANINYSELSYLWESWLRVRTNNAPEAIENSAQKKGPSEYRQLMTNCFKETYRILKPGHWMTVEFSNTKASVWNNIQTALTDAGFIVANVSALDKKQGSFKAVTTPTAVKQDLIISAYKPNGGFSERFEQEANSEEGAWDFARTHLKYLPVVKTEGGALAPIPERDPRILYDQLVAFYVRKNLFVPLSSQEFQAGLHQRFAERDGMYFLPEQVAEYDRKKMLAEKVLQRSLFVSDEASAIDWLRVLLKDKPQTYQDLHPQFIQQTQRAWKKTETPMELSTLLEQSFLRYDGSGRVPEQIHRYLSSNWKELRNLEKDDPALQKKAADRWYVPDPNKAADLEKLRERSLLKEFAHYKEAARKLKVFRLEAVRAGFKKCWQERDFVTIIQVAEKIHHRVLEEDPKLLMWYDQAQVLSEQ